MLNSEKFAILLKELGGSATAQGPYDCPIHSGHPGTLHFNPNEILPGGFHVACTYPRCGFSGSILELAASAKRRSVQEVSQLFTPGNRLHDLFFAASGNDDADRDFIKFEVIRYETYCKAAEYLLLCKSAFLNSSKARQFFISKGVKEDLLQKMGCCAPVSNAPDRFSGCVPTKGLENYVMIPYLTGDVATDMSVYDLRDGSRMQHSLEKKSRGIFLSEFLPRMDVGNITVCHNELDAMVLLSKISDVGTQGINPVAIIDPAAAMQIPKLVSITLLSHADTPAPLAYVIDYLRLSPALKISMVELPGALSMVSSTKVRKIFDHAVEGWAWLASRINAISRDEGLTRLAAQLAGLGLVHGEKAMILDRLQEMGITNLLLMEEIRNARPACLVRECGSIQVKRTFAGYEQLMPYGRQLSNFILIVNYYTGETEEKIMAATIKTDRAGCPGYDITIPVKDLRTRDGTKLMHIVWNRLIELGVKFNMQASTVMDIDWFTIIRMFDDAEYKEQSRVIGIEGTCIRYPAMKINLASGVSTGADVLPNLPAIVTQSYGMVKGHERSIGDIAARLHNGKDDAVDSFLGIMGHILYETARATRPGYRPRHLIIPSSAPESVTDVMLGQVNSLLGGSSDVMTIPGDFSKQKQFFASSNLLGGLPMICKSLDVIDGFVRKLNTSRNSMVVMYPEALLPQHSRIANAYYMSEILSQDHCELSQEILDMLRARWGTMLAATYSAELNSELPALAWMDKFCKGMPDSYLFTLEPFSNGSLDEYHQFLDLLAHLAEIGKITLAPNLEAFLQCRRRPSDVGYAKGVVVRISPGLVYRIMKSHGAAMDWRGVSALMTDNGHWIQSGSYRQMHMNTWTALTCKDYGLKMLTSEDLEKTA